MAGQFNFNTRLIIPAVSDVEDEITSKEINQIYSGMRSLAQDLTDSSFIGFTGVTGDVINPGAFVCINTATGTIDPASALTTFTLAVGWYDGDSTLAVGEPITVRQGGMNSKISGLTPGLLYYLADPATGQITSGGGTVLQAVGRALSSTTLAVYPLP